MGSGSKAQRVFIGIPAICMVIASISSAQPTERDLEEWQAAAVEIPLDDPHLSLSLWCVQAEDIDDIPDPYARAHLQFFTASYPPDAQQIFQSLNAYEEFNATGYFVSPSIDRWRIGQIPMQCDDHITHPTCPSPYPRVYLFVGDDSAGSRGNTLITADAELRESYSPLDESSVIVQETIGPSYITIMEPLNNLRWAGLISDSRRADYFYAEIRQGFDLPITRQGRRAILDRLSDACSP
ncbi:MAG: hypothetical protein H6843_10845 [Rhodospirillaceae bacterium]|nr:hypothetical protein [Rhodospirillaceae bacterium]